MNSQNTNSPRKENAIFSSNKLMEFFFKTLDVVMDHYIKDGTRPPSLFLDDGRVHRFADMDGQGALEVARELLSSLSQKGASMYVIVADGYVDFENKKCDAVIFEIGEKGTNFGERFSQRYQNELGVPGAFQILGNPGYMGKTENYYKRQKEDKVDQFQSKNKVQKWIKEWSSQRSSKVGIGKIFGIFLAVVMFGFVVSALLNPIYNEFSSYRFIIFAAVYLFPVAMTCILFSYYPPDRAPKKVKMIGVGMGIIAVCSVFLFSRDEYSYISDFSIPTSIFGGVFFGIAVSIYLFFIKKGRGNESEQNKISAENKVHINYIKDQKDRKNFKRLLLFSLLFFFVPPFLLPLFKNNLLYMISTGVFFFVSLVGIISAIIIATRKTLDPNVPHDQRSGRGRLSEIPSNLGKWNWGAAGLAYIWGIYFRKWSSLLSLIPILNIFWMIVMGLKGNEWAWRNNRWESVNEFKRVQNKWKIWGILFFIIRLGNEMYVIFILMAILITWIQK